MYQNINGESSSSPNDISENRKSPTWGSNLLIQEDTFKYDVASTANSNRFLESLKDVESFVIEYDKDVVVKKSTIPIGHKSSIDESFANQEDVDKDDEHGNVNEEASGSLGRSEEILEDSRVVTYFKEQLEEYKTRQKIRRAVWDHKMSSPAEAGIPVTTPRSSPVPRRLIKERDFEEESPLYEVIEEKSDEQINSLEDEDEEYREWQMRLKHLQTVLERCLNDIESKKGGKVKPSCSRE